LAIGQRQSLTIRDAEIFQTDEVFGKHNDHVVDAFTRIDPISLSADAFCHGEPGAIGLSRMPMARKRRATAAP
jgi:hypothetical protein